MISELYRIWHFMRNPSFKKRGMMFLNNISAFMYHLEIDLFQIWT